MSSTDYALLRYKLIRYRTNDSIIIRRITYLLPIMSVRVACRVITCLCRADHHNDRNIHYRKIRIKNIFNSITRHTILRITRYVWKQYNHYMNIKSRAECFHVQRISFLIT